MNKQTQALKLALEALEDAKKNHGLVYVTELCAIREALAEQPAQQQCMEHGECFGGECIYPAQQPAQQQSCYCPNCEALSKELAAIKAQQQEPVGAVTVSHYKGLENRDFDYWGSLPDGTHNLYTSPPASKPLTDEQRKDILAMWSRENRNYTVADIIDAVEAAHGIKEKNNG